MMLDRIEQKAGDCRVMEVWIHEATGKVAKKVVVGYSHAPYPVSKKDKHGNFDHVMCRRCGATLLGSFI